MKSLIIKRCGIAIEILSPDGPLPEKLVCELHAHFKYQKKESEFHGRRRIYTSTDVYLLSDTPNGTLTTSYGMFPSVKRYLQEEGYQLQFQDVTPREKNYNLLEPDMSVINNYQLRFGQRECIDAFIHKRHGIICAPVGFGKTFLISVLIKLYPTARFHICTKSRAVLQEIYTRLKMVSNDVGIYCSDAKITGKRVMCVTAASLGAIEGDAAFFIFDECHQAAATTYSAAILDKYRFSRLYGFSATPEGRSDGADAALTFLFGDVIFNMTYDEGVDNGLVVPINVHWLKCNVADSTSSSWTTDVAKFRHMIWRNRHRNALIRSYVENIPVDKKVLILVSSVEHAVYLSSILPEYTLVYGSMSKDDCDKYKNMDLLPYDYIPLKAKDRKSLQDDFKSGKIKKVIATDVWSTGVDFPDLEYVVNASGRSSVITTTQGGGRGSRLFTGKTSATVVDVVDCFDGTASSFYRGSLKRKKTYSELGWNNENW